MTDRLLRGLDLFLAVAVLIVLSPLLLAIVAVAWLTQGRPILYCAPRVGRGGTDFLMSKFRTMVVGSDAGASSTAQGDARVTRLGSQLRRYKLDELPQLLNVLKGEMSLVGPRPQVRWATELYGPREALLLSVRPGMTDLSSVWFRDEADRLAGFADPDAAYLRLIAPGKTALGLANVERRSVRLYLRILQLTALAVAGHDVRARIIELTGIDADSLALTIE